MFSEKGPEYSRTKESCSKVIFVKIGNGVNDFNTLIKVLFGSQIGRAGNHFAGIWKN